MSPKSFAEIGLPVGHGFPELAYQHVTGYVIAHTRPLESGSPSKRLSIRKLTESHYVPIAEFEPNVSVESYCLSQTLPLLYFTTFSWTRIDDQFSPTKGAAGHAGNWEALFRYQTDNRQCAVVAKKGDLRTAGEYSGIWLTTLLSVTHDGQTLYVVAGIESSSKLADYFLCELNLSDNHLKPLSKLEAVFA